MNHPSVSSRKTIDDYKDTVDEIKKQFYEIIKNDVELDRYYRKVSDTRNRGKTRYHMLLKNPGEIKD